MIFGWLWTRGRGSPKLTFLWTSLSFSWVLDQQKNNMGVLIFPRKEDFVTPRSHMLSIYILRGDFYFLSNWKGHGRLSNILLIYHRSITNLIRNFNMNASSLWCGFVVMATEKCSFFYVIEIPKRVFNESTFFQESMRFLLQQVMQNSRSNRRILILRFNGQIPIKTINASLILRVETVLSRKAKQIRTNVNEKKTLLRWPISSERPITATKRLVHVHIYIFQKYLRPSLRDTWMHSNWGFDQLC